MSILIPWPVALGVFCAMLILAAGATVAACGLIKWIISTLTPRELPPLCGHCDVGRDMPCTCPRYCGRWYCPYNPAGIDRLIAELRGDQDGCHE